MLLHMQIIELEEKAFDIICGMELDIQNAEYAVEYHNEVYYFCNASCKEHFIGAPNRYIGSLDT